MTTYIRTLVSGNKARYRDKDLNVDLGSFMFSKRLVFANLPSTFVASDLAYITDNVIVMGYPAAGLEGLYRNRREDAKKFLQHRHGNNFWVFNVRCPCFSTPIKLTSYSSSVLFARTLTLLASSTDA